MPSSQTLVVDASDEGSTLDRTLRRALRDSPPGSEVVVVAPGSLRLDPTLARRVRLVRERTPDAVVARVAALVADGAVLANPRRRLRDRCSIGACLIVRDEEAVLGRCLDALAPFVDEVVVYDTGSTDATLAVARRTGATVVEGFWDDHFGDARNRALVHSTTDWVLFVDADEVAVGDPAALRDVLAAETADVLAVAITSTSWSGGEEGTETRTQRVARRHRVRWEGRVHEQLVDVASGRELPVGRGLAPVRLVHSGYHGAVVHEKAKGARNARLAEMELVGLAPGDPGFAKRASDLGRSLLAAGRLEEGLAALEPLASVTGESRTVLSGGRLCVVAMTQARRLDDARRWSDVLERNGESRGNLAVARALIALAEDDVDAARRCAHDAVAADETGPDLDAWGIPFDSGTVVPVQVAVDLLDGRADLALSHLVEQMLTDPEKVDLGQVVRAVEGTGASWADVLAGVSERFLDGSVRRAVAMGQGGLPWCAGFAGARPGDHRPLVAGCLLAGGGDLTTALTWSVMAREAGLPELCPVRAGAEDPGRPAHQRALWWALLADSFGEFDARARFAEQMASVSPVDAPGLRSSLEHLAPDLVAAGTGGDR